MSGKLDQSLEEILSTSRRSGGRGGAKTRGKRVATTKAAPVGGIKKQKKPTPTGPSSQHNARGVVGSGVLVSGLPKDVSEPQIKEYFGNSVGPIKKVEISYGPGGVSRGTATIIFHRSDSAAKAVEKLDGISVDNRPIKVDVIIDAKVAKALPAPKGLSERISVKAKPKSAAVIKPATGAARGGKAARGRGGKDTTRARPAKKTSDELDSEMADYFEKGTNAGAPVAGDAVMDDEIL
ncbi:putative mRNA export protein mlo3 [Calycina marina]|uniref:mRNA export protein mlo3 n=1 Tax=Calycina marina TaxID=1763456 RepID=A0A9P7ZBZ9_9HELO|nr:putative mRNA export protein mlo3 [Calycina marina]